MHESRQAESISARDFVERELRANPDASYADVQARASRLGINVQRFLYGSMRRSLGLPPRPEVTEAPASPQAMPSAPPVVAAAPAEAVAEPEPEAEPEAGPDDGPDDIPDAPPAAEGSAISAKGSAFELAVATLRMSPDMSFQDLRARAAMEGLQMPPIVYGRAKALLGLVPTKPRRPKVEPPRLLRQVESAGQMDRLPALDGIRSLEQLVATVRALENERQRLRAAMAAILDTVNEALQDD